MTRRKYAGFAKTLDTLAHHVAHLAARQPKAY